MTFQRIFAVLAVTLFSLSLVVTATPAQAHKATSYAGKYENRIIKLVNQERTSRGLRPVKKQSCITGYAHDYARKMDRRNLWEHSNLGNLLSRCNLRYASENLAKVPKGYTPRQTVKLWMSSPGHRANILKKRARLTGVAVQWDRSRQAYIIVHNFGQK